MATCSTGPSDETTRFLPATRPPALFEHGVLELRGWRFHWDDVGGGLRIFHDDDPIRVEGLHMTKEEVTRLLDLEPF